MAHEIVLQWTPSVTPVSGYNVYRGTLPGNEGPLPINGAILVTGTQYTDLGVYPGKVYSYEITSVVGGIESADSIGVLSASIPFGPTPASPYQGGLDGFVVLAATAVTNVGTTNASGDVGVYPGTSITGFGPPSAISGIFHVADFVAAAGQSAAQSMYNALVAMNTPAKVAIVADLGGTTLLPGIYNSASSIGLTGDLILDAQGNPNAVWVFQAGSAVTVAGNVILVNGAQASNVFWQVGSSMSIAADNLFCGVVIAQASITVAAGAQISGRLFALAGAITLSGDNITFFLQVPFSGAWSASTSYTLGVSIFDCATNSFQQVVTAGTSGATRPTFSGTPQALTTDGSISWEAVTLENAFIVLATPLSPPNVPPAPPAAPTGLFIALEN